MDLQYRLGAAPAPVLKAVALMEAHIEAPLSIALIADRLALSTRQLERLFHQAFDVTPARYYLDLRLETARKLLHLSSLSVLDVALASGFVSASHFAKAYRLHFGQAPRAHRHSDNRQSEIFPL
jgi:transcriptional regulator GlxA family with amidase domain